MLVITLMKCGYYSVTDCMVETWGAPLEYNSVHMRDQKTPEKGTFFIRRHVTCTRVKGVKNSIFGRKGYF